MAANWLILEFTWRMMSTAILVIILSKAVMWAGPKFGGTVAGLPVVLGPGFYFMIGNSSKTFLADAAAASLFALCAVQVFLIAYIYGAGRSSARTSLAMAIVAWGSVAVLVRHMPPNSIIGLTLFIITSVLVRRLGKSQLITDVTPQSPDNHWVILLRGGLAGILVGSVTLASSAIGPNWTGLAISFPVAFAVISVTVHMTRGRAAVISMLHAATLGTASLAAFCAGMAFLVQGLNTHLAFAIALLLSIATTSLLVMRVGGVSSKSDNKA